MTLTIAIPTYNHGDLLCKNLSHLLPQLTPECELLILDNCSASDIEARVRPMFHRFPNTKSRVIRHPVNIGGNANVLRCFELCETPWLWVLSDAYPPVAGAVERILSLLHERPNDLFINMRAPGHSRETSFSTSGLDEFIRGIDDFGFVLMISTSVYNARTLVENLQYAYHFAYTCAPHLVLLLYALLLKSGTCHFSELSVVNNKEPGQYWSVTHYPLIMALTDLALPREATLMLRRKLGKELGKYWPAYTRQCAQLALKDGNEWRLCYKHRLLRTRYSYGNLDPRTWIRLAVVAKLIKHPRLTQWVYRLLKGHDMLSDAIPDPLLY